MGATLATSGSIDSIHLGGLTKGLMGKIVLPMCFSPILGFVAGLAYVIEKLI